MNRLLLSIAFALGLAPCQLRAQEDGTRDFVAANLIAIFYHELGHALIDVMALPIFGQEEDAADVLSVLLIHESFDEESAVDIAYATAYGFLSSAVADEGAEEDVAWWDVHAPDLQRYYTFVCLFYGANPEAREDIADELGLPPIRAETCSDEFDLADGSWGPVLDTLYEAGPGRSLRYTQEKDGDDWAALTGEVILEEVEALNSDLTLPERLSVSVERCGEPNAFYDPDRNEITVCTEFAGHLARIAPP